jgi:hypothetical protein
MWKWNENEFQIHKEKLDLFYLLWFIFFLRYGRQYKALHVSEVAGDS